MGWNVLFDPEFALEFAGLPIDVKTEILARAELLKLRGPHLGRPYVDTLNGSRHANMKELRFSSGLWGMARCVRVQPGPKCDSVGSGEQVAHE